MLASLLRTNELKLGSLALLLATFVHFAEQQQQQLRRTVERLHNSGPETLDIIAARGFRGELYLTLSRDGYVLSIYHIINPLADKDKLDPIPVLMMHGILGDSSQLIGHSKQARPRKPTPGQVIVELGGQDDCLAFMLANNNYDVYLADTRGSSLNNHKAVADLDWNEAQRYWNFSLDEQALNDVPAMVDFVLAHTGAPKLHYIGYSQSTFMMFALLSAKPEYQTKLASFVALAPVAFVAHLRGTSLPMMLPVLSVPDQVNGNYLPQTFIDSIGTGLRKFCANQITKSLCSNTLPGVAGLGLTSDSASFYTTAFKSTSLRAVKHFMQLFRDKRFGMYDFGPRTNMIQYGSIRPPDYELNRISLPTIVLVRGHNDFLSTAQDQEQLIRSLGTRPYLDILLPAYNHLDFLISRTLLHDINLPVANALLKIGNALKQQQSLLSSSSSSSSRQSATERKGHHKPVAISRPNGSRQLVINEKFGSNLMESVAEVAQKSTQTLVPQFAADGMQRSLNLLTKFGRVSDDIGQRLDTMTNRIIGEQM